MIKYIALLLLFISCNSSAIKTDNIAEPETIAQMLSNPYRVKFHLYADSQTYYFNKAECYYYCRKIDSFKHTGKFVDRFTDSANKYYKLLYPNEKDTVTKEVKSVCSCN